MKAHVPLLLSLLIFSLLTLGCAVKKIDKFAKEQTKAALNKSTQTAQNSAVCQVPSSMEDSEKKMRERLCALFGGTYFRDPQDDEKGQQLDSNRIINLLFEAEQFIEQNYLSDRKENTIVATLEASEIDRLKNQNTEIRKENVEAGKKRKQAAIVADFLYQLGKRVMQFVSRQGDKASSPANSEDFVIAEMIIATAARAENPDALFDLAVLYSSPAGTKESRNSAISFFYRAGLAYLEPPVDLPKAADAAEGIIRIDSAHPYAKALNCKISDQLNPSNCETLIVKTPEKKNRGTEESSAIAAQDISTTFPEPTTTILGVVNNRETAESIYINYNVSDISFGSTGGDKKEQGLLKELSGARIRSITAGYDFTKQLSLAIMTNLEVSDGRVKDLQGKTVNLANDSTDTESDITLAGGNFEFYQMTLYYYPGENFHLGVGKLNGTLTLNGEKDAQGSRRTEFIVVDENLVVLGYTYDFFDTRYRRSVNNLSLSRSTLTPQINISYSFPLSKSKSIIESMITTSIGLRFF